MTLKEFYENEAPWWNVRANDALLEAKYADESYAEAANRLGASLAFHPDYTAAWNEYVSINIDAEESVALMFEVFRNHTVQAEAQEVEDLRTELKAIRLRDGYQLQKLDLVTLRATALAVRETRRLQSASTAEVKAAIQQGQRKSPERTLPGDWLIPGTQTVLKLDRENIFHVARTNRHLYRKLFEIFGSQLIDARLRGES